MIELSSDSSISSVCTYKTNTKETNTETSTIKNNPKSTHSNNTSRGELDPEDYIYDDGYTAFNNTNDEREFRFQFPLEDSSGIPLWNSL